MTRILKFNTLIHLLLLGSAFLSLSGCSGGGSSTPAPPPPVIPVLSISAVAGDETATIGWSSIDGATSYALYRWIDPEPAAQIASISSPSSSYTDTGLYNGTTYYYRVEALSGSVLIPGAGQVISVTPNPPDGNVVITGSVQYQDKIYDAAGFTGDEPYKSVRYAAVEIVPTAGGDPLASGPTDSNGVYSISTSPGQEVYVRVNAEALLGNKIQVKDLSNHIYALRSNDFVLSGPANVNVYIPTTSPAGGAFNILDVLTSGAQFVHGRANVYPPQLSAFWEYDSWDGTYYCTGGCLPDVGIYILGDYNGDTDGYDDDVIWHEFGHFAANEFSKDDSQGGPHYLGENDQDLRLAWSEGWGNFVPLAIKDWMRSADPERLSAAAGTSSSLYVDTDEDVYIAFDFGSALANPAYYYSSNEVAVANVLWRLNEGGFGIMPIWEVFSQELPAAAIVNLEAFWDGWIALRSSGWEYDPNFAVELSALFTIYGNRQIFYKKDLSEDDNNFSSATVIDDGPGNSQVHYLYSGSAQSDSDFFVFTPSSSKEYQVSTSGLSNGTDTYITIYNSTQVKIAENDNYDGVTYTSATAANDDKTLSSKVIFTASKDETYYIEVKPSPARPVSAGRYGTYTITIQ